MVTSEEIIWHPWESYFVSSTGVVRNSRGHILAQHVDTHGYLRVQVQRSGKSCSVKVHRIVVDAFLGGLSPGQETRHLDGNKMNNSVSNLAVGSHSENEMDKTMHGTRANRRNGTHGSLKLSEEMVQAVSIRHENGETVSSIAKEIGMNANWLRQVIKDAKSIL